MAEKNEIIAAANLFSFASQSYWPISEGKTNLISELCYKGKEKYGERERKREREREARVSDNKGVRSEKVKGREKKWESLPWENLPWERDCFPKKIFGKQPIKNKSYFY